MDKNEFWILDSVVEQKYSLGMLTMDGVSAIYDRPDHGMDRATTGATVAALFKRGWLIATNEDRGDFQPSEAELEDALDSQFDADYGLTPAGGDAWAEAAKPNWNRFVQGEFGETDEDGEFDSIARERIGAFCCGDEEYLRKYLESIHYRGIIPHEPSIKWDTVAPWQALYWKEIPIAHRARFVGVMGPQYPEEKIPEEYRGMGQWYENAQRHESGGGCGTGCGCEG